MPGDSPLATLVTLRRLLLAILLFGLVGTATELVLIGHDEDAWQMIPLVVLAVALLASVVMVATVAPASPAIRLFRGAMLLLMLSGATGSRAPLPRQHGVQARDGSLVERLCACSRASSRPRPRPRSRLATWRCSACSGSRARFVSMVRHFAELCNHHKELSYDSVLFSANRCRRHGGRRLQPRRGPERAGRERARFSTSTPRSKRTCWRCRT